MKKLALILTILLFFFAIVPNSRASSASLYLSPLTGRYTIRSTFSIVVRVNSGGVPINAAEGSLTFNNEELNVVSISRAGSIFSLWTTEPSFSNAAGTIEFGGGTPVSFTGAAGTIITIVLRAQKSTTADVNFISGAVLAADGRGTNILANMNNGAYILEPVIIAPPPTPIRAPAVPNVSSLTHPDPEKWYSNNDPEFFWKVPADVTAVRLLIDKMPRATPIVLYVPPISERKLEDLADGTWYFHAQFRNQYGWGGISHRKVLIDTEAPESFKIKVDNEGDPTNPFPLLRFESKDKISGTDFYEIKIDEKEPERVTPEEMKVEPYRIPWQEPGKHSVIVKAVDRAGNITLSSKEFIVEPIEPPIITKFPEKLQEGDFLALGGRSFSGYTVLVYIQKERETPTEKEVKTDQQGNWSYLHEESVKRGVYNVWVRNKSPKGALSYPTEKITIAVTLPTLLEFGKIAIEYVSIIITLIVLIIGVIAIIFYTWYRISIWRKRLQKETKEVAQSVDKTFSVLREVVQRQIEYLDKKPGLTKREKEARDKLQEALNISEEFISKEIKDAEKEL